MSEDRRPCGYGFGEKGIICSFYDVDNCIGEKMEDCERRKLINKQGIEVVLKESPNIPLDSSGFESKSSLVVGRAR